MQRCPYIHEMKERLLGQPAAATPLVEPRREPPPPPREQHVPTIVKPQETQPAPMLNPDGYGSHTSPARAPLVTPEDLVPETPPSHHCCHEVFETQPKGPKNAKTSLFIIMSFIYAKLLVVICIAYVIGDVITHNLPLYYYEGFFTYLYGMSILFLLYVFCFLLQESACCNGGSPPKPKPPPKEKKPKKEKEKKTKEKDKEKDAKKDGKNKDKDKEKEKDKEKDASKEKPSKEAKKQSQFQEVYPRKMRDIVREQQLRRPPLGEPQQQDIVEIESGVPLRTTRKRKTSQNDNSHGSFFLRIGAIAFGLGTMIYNGLEFGTFFEVPFHSPCYQILRGVNPVLQMVFTFMQMYFIFMNSRLNIHRFKVVARFGLMHVVATNLCVWIRTLVLESLKEITAYHTSRPDVPEDGIILESIRRHTLRNSGTVLGINPVTTKATTTVANFFTLPTTAKTYINRQFLNVIKTTTTAMPTTTSSTLSTTTTTSRMPFYNYNSNIDTGASKILKAIKSTVGYNLYDMHDANNPWANDDPMTTPNIAYVFTTPSPTPFNKLTSRLTTTINSISQWIYSTAAPYITEKSTLASTSTARTSVADGFDLWGGNMGVNTNTYRVDEPPHLFTAHNNTGEVFESFDSLNPAALISSANLTQCPRINIMGTIVQDSAPYLYPFIIEYSLIGAAVIYVMWKHIGRHPNYIAEEDLERRLEAVLSRRAAALAQARRGGRVDCAGASKGLFCGLLLLVGALICLILFFVLVKQEGLMRFAIYLADVSHCVLMVLSIFAIIIGFIRVQSLKFRAEESSDLNDILLRVSAFGLFVYAVFSVIAGSLGAFTKEPNMLVMITGILSVVQVVLQLLFIADVSRRRVHLPEQERSKPARQTVTFLLICNVTMWMIYTFEAQKVALNPVQRDFYGFLAWSIVQRLTLPLCIFHRFHSAVTLAEIWKTSYKARLD